MSNSTPRYDEEDIASFIGALESITCLGFTEEEIGTIKAFLMITKIPYMQLMHRRKANSILWVDTDNDLNHKVALQELFTSLGAITTNADIYADSFKVIGKKT